MIPIKLGFRAGAFTNRIPQMSKPYSELSLGFLIILRLFRIIGVPRINIVPWGAFEQQARDVRLN